VQVRARPPRQMMPVAGHCSGALLLFLHVGHPALPMGALAPVRQALRPAPLGGRR